MARTKYSNAGWSGNVAEVISGAFTLTAQDNGKIFLCQAATITLPTVSEMVGWNATFIRSSGSSTVNSLTLDAAHDAALVVSDGTSYLNFKTIS